MAHTLEEHGFGVVGFLRSLGRQRQTLVVLLLALEALLVMGSVVIAPFQHDKSDNNNVRSTSSKSKLHRLTHEQRHREVHIDRVVVHLTRRAGIPTGVVPHKRQLVLARTHRFKLLNRGIAKLSVSLGGGLDKIRVVCSYKTPLAFDNDGTGASDAIPVEKTLLSKRVFVGKSCSGMVIRHRNARSIAATGGSDVNIGTVG